MTKTIRCRWWWWMTKVLNFINSTGNMISSLDYSDFDEKKSLRKSNSCQLPMIFSYPIERTTTFCWQKIIFQGIVGCTPTNVPLWEIPILALYSGYLWVIIPKNPLEYCKRHSNLGRLVLDGSWDQAADFSGWIIPNPDGLFIRPTMSTIRIPIYLCEFDVKQLWK